MRTITKVADAKRWVDELLADQSGWSRLDDGDESFWVYEPGASDVCANGDPWISVICLTCAMGVEPAEARRHRGHPLGARIWVEVLDHEGAIAQRTCDVSLEDLGFFIPAAVWLLERHPVPPSKG